MINITDKDQSNYRIMTDYEVCRYVKYAQAYAFRQVKELTWEVDYFREITSKNFKSPKYTHPNF